MDICEYIESRVDYEIQWYSKKSQHCQKMYKIFQVSEIILASSIPLLSAYSEKSTVIAITVGIFGAISYYNYSAPKEKPLFPHGTPYTSSDIANKITEKIRPAQVTLVISGMYGAYSEWMQYEIDESLRLGKPIIGVYPWGQINAPLYVTNHATEMVRWNTDSIISAIRRYA